MTKHFGKTWWGQQWLHSLSNIDYSNRLPRGSRYARNGSVREITIERNEIQAKVSGSQPRPYKVSITLPLFSKEGLRNFLDRLAQHPGLISKLLNRQLDPAVLDLASQAGLKVFPTEWRDFKMHCNCPDSAVPCKHLAAVIYKVCAEIDNNPFVVFDLHGVDLLSTLSERGIFISTTHAVIPSFESYCRTPEKKKGKWSKKDQVGYQEENSYQKLRFSTLTATNGPLIALLEESPAFYQGAGNFKDKYRQKLTSIIKNAGKVIAKSAVFNHSATEEQGNTKNIIGKRSQLTLLTDAQFNSQVAVDSENISFEQFSEAISRVPISEFQDYQPATACFYQGYFFALHLLASGAVIPQILLIAEHKYLIRWMPALLSKPVRELVQDFTRMIPPEAFLWIDEHGQQPVELERAQNLLSLFLTELVESFQTTAREDVFINLFFQQQVHSFDGPGESNISGGIQAWLQRYFVSHSKYKPQIVVADHPKLSHFLLEISIQVEHKGAVAPVSLQNMLKQNRYDKIRFEALKSLSLLSHLIKGLDTHINGGATTALVMDNETFTHFLMQMVPIIQLLDIDILLPKALQTILKPKSSIQIKADPNQSFLKLNELLSFDWQIAVGDSVMSEEAFKKLLKHSDGLIRYKSQYIYVSKEELQKLYAHFSQTKEISSFELLRTALSGDYNGAEVALTKEVNQLIQKITKTKEVSLPVSLQASLRPYQKRGFSWLYKNAQIGFGSVIADDMGLGKTLQVITTLLKYKEEGLLDHKKVLVVAPTGLLTNWLAEIEKFAPTLVAKIFHGSHRRMEKDFDILLTSYGIVRSDVAKLKKAPWHSLVIDEAQNIKNQHTRQAKAIKSIGADNYIAMSGTPVENRLSELWSILDFSNRGILGTPKQFLEDFSKPIETFNDESVASKLRKVTAPFMLRRLKTDKKIISDLPDKMEMDCFASLVEQQASLYESTLKEAMKGIEAIDPNDKKRLFARRGLVLQLILALKQICNHPTQFLKNKVLDNSQSGKLALLFDKLDAITKSGEKVLIFTQFAEMGKLLQHFITERYAEAPLFYHGGCTVKQRKAMTEAFQQNHADKIFILSLKAAGTGLNLTAASHVIHYDLWWNPAVEAQATDRAYRIGQEKNVMVHRFITKNTFEERINEMIQSKKALAGMTVSSGENWIGNLSNQELKDVFEIK